MKKLKLDLLFRFFGYLLTMSRCDFAKCCMLHATGMGYGAI